jgi:hypothetical protein
MQSENKECYPSLVHMVATQATIPHGYDSYDK